MFRKIIIGILMTLICFGEPGLADGYIPKAGEVLEYKVIVKSMLHGANQTIRVLGRETYRNRETLRVQCAMQSIGLARKMFAMTEYEEMLLDVEGMFPWYLKREVNEKEKTEKEEVVFDYDRGIAVRVHSKNGSTARRDEMKLPSGHVHDWLSLLFFLRSSELKPKRDSLNYYSKGSIETVNYEIIESAGELKLDCGVFSKYYQIDNEAIGISIMIAANSERYPLIIRKNAGFGKIESRLAGFSK